jgi:hypothetical protein
MSMNALAPTARATAAPLKMRKQAKMDELQDWRLTQFHIWPGEYCPVLRRQADMGLSIKTTDDELEELRTAPESRWTANEIGAD